MRRSILVVVSVALAGCPSPDDGPKTIRDDPGVQRYASALLPWPPRATFDEFTGGKGAKLYRNFWHKLTNQTQLYERATQLAALVALPSSLVAIYAPADADGLIIAHGGIDQPWERIPLTDIPVNDIGAIDAHTTRDGGVIIGVRRRSGAQPISLYAWRPGASVESIPFERPAPSYSHWTNERCEDLAIGVSPAGDLDVIFRQNRQFHAESQTLLHARRAAGQSAFVFSTLEDTTTLPPPQTEVRHDIGCRLRLVYNQFDQLQVMSLHTMLPRSAFMDLNATIDNPPYVGIDSYSLGTMGWVPGGPSATGGGGPPPDAAYWFTGQFDVTLHPAGYTVSGVNRNTTNDPELTLAINTDPALLPSPNLEYGLDLDENDSNAFAATGGPASGGAIIVDECGGIRLWSSESGLRHGFVDTAFSGNVLYCGGERLAPVARFAEDEDQWGFAELPVVARGPRSYHAALCLMDETSLAICEGGHDFSHVTAHLHEILGEDESVEIVSSTPANGAIDIPTTLTEIRVTMSRPLNADEQITAQLANVHTGIPEFLPGPSTVAGELVITLPPLQPRTLYRVSVPYIRPERSFTYIDKQPPVLTFRTGS